MPSKNEKKITESEKVLALTVMLTGILLLTVASALGWLIYFLFFQQNMFGSLTRQLANY